MDANLTTKTSTRRVIWTCKCGTRAHDYTATRRALGADRFGVVQYSDAVMVRLVDGATRDISADAYCDACRTYRKSVKVVGRVTDHKCSAKCLASKGAVCDCSCGGTNHGRAYL